MARTAAGDELTRVHRAEQLAVRAGSLGNLVTLWRIVDPTDLSNTIETFARAAAILAGQGFEESGAVAARYYSLFRRVEGIGDIPPGVTVATRPPLDSLAGDLRGAALTGIINARRSGLDIESSRSRGLVRVLGTLGKLVLNGGRRTIIDNVQHDRQAVGWARVTSGDPCAFCRMLASRGPTYKSAKSADFHPHDTCACSVETVYRGGMPTDQAEEYAREWQEAQRIAREDGTSSTGTGNNALNNYRRYLAGKATAT